MIVMTNTTTNDDVDDVTMIIAIDGEHGRLSACLCEHRSASNVRIVHFLNSNWYANNIQHFTLFDVRFFSFNFNRFKI